MSFDENPYRVSVSTQESGGLPKEPISLAIITPFAKLSFWFGLAFAFLGSLVSFGPGDQYIWFVPNGLLFAMGLLIPNRGYRIAAIVLSVLCFLYAYSGHQNGIQNQQWLHSQPIVEPD